MVLQKWFKCNTCYFIALFVTFNILSTWIYKKYSSDNTISLDAKASYPYQQSNFALKNILDDDFPL